jgi:hypothetical protein
MILKRDRKLIRIKKLKMKFSKMANNRQVVLEVLLDLQSMLKFMRKERNSEKLLR